MTYISTTDPKIRKSLRHNLLKNAAWYEKNHRYFRAAVYRELYRRDLQLKEIVASVSRAFGEELNYAKVNDALNGRNKSARAARIRNAIQSVLALGDLNHLVVKEQKYWDDVRAVTNNSSGGAYPDLKPKPRQGITL